LDSFLSCRELEAELIRHEALLNKMHEDMQQSQPVSSTYGTTTPTNVDKDKEEQLWAQQRLVTALKRKVILCYQQYFTSYCPFDVMSLYSI
jgi:hypothetical protein